MACDLSERRLLINDFAGALPPWPVGGFAPPELSLLLFSRTRDQLIGPPTPERVSLPVVTGVVGVVQAISPETKLACSPLWRRSPMAEFLTAVRAGLPVKVVVNNNNSLGQILWEQMVLGYPEQSVRYPEPPADVASWAAACGGYGAKVTKPGDLEDSLGEALFFDGPALVDVDVNPNEPPLPGKVDYEQAKKFALAFLTDQPNRAAIATTLFKDNINQLKS